MGAKSRRGGREVGVNKNSQSIPRPLEYHEVTIASQTPGSPLSGMVCVLLFIAAHDKVRLFNAQSLARMTYKNDIEYFFPRNAFHRLPAVYV